MKGIMSDDQIANLTDLISTADLDQGDIDRLQDGDFSVLQKLVDQFGEESLKEFQEAIKKSAEIEKRWLAFSRKELLWRIS